MAEEDAQRPHFDEALRAADEIADHDAWIAIAHRLGTHLQRRALSAEALPLFEGALERARTARSGEHALLATCLSNLGLLLQDLGKPDEALTLMNESVALAEQTYGAEHPKLAKRLSNLATILLTLGRATEARPFLDRALVITERAHGSNHPKVAAVLSNLAAVLRDDGQLEQAKRLLQRVLAIYESEHGPHHPDVAAALCNLGHVLRAAGEGEQARGLFERALAIATAVYGPRHPGVAALQATLHTLPEENHEPISSHEHAVAEAAPVLLRAHQIVWPSPSPPSALQSVAVSSWMATTVLSGVEVRRRPTEPRPLLSARKPVGRWVGEGEDGFGRWATFEVDGVAQRLRWIPPGRFLMGSPEGEVGWRDNEGPQHEVELTSGYWLAETPCTQALWQAVIGENPSRFKGPYLPVEQVSWDDCQIFMDRINAMVPGLDARLPSEAEWEYACRGGTKTATWVGDLEILGESNAPLLDPIAWYGGNSGVGFDLPFGYDSSKWPEKQFPYTKAGTRPVAKKLPNPHGLYDMLGNVWEWCKDWRGAYEANPVNDPCGPETGSLRVLRRGSWNGNARLVRAARRIAGPPGNRSDDLGFRLARGQAPSSRAEPRLGEEPILGRSPDGGPRSGR
jgi:formylglycine-generating enzyme required for sulfatase activity/Tfp pilus assembly protein PilF